MIKQFKHKKLWWIAEKIWAYKCKIMVEDVEGKDEFMIPYLIVENSDDREEIKTPTHFGNWMCNDPFWQIFTYKSDDRNNFKTQEYAHTFSKMMQTIYKIRQRHSENDGKFGEYSMYYDITDSKWDWGYCDKSIWNVFIPVFSSKEKVKACINHFWSELDILLSWYNMQKNNH